MLSMSTTIGDVTGAGTVSVASTEDADVVDIDASTVTAYVVVLLVGFVDFLEFSIFVVVRLNRYRAEEPSRSERSDVRGERGLSYTSSDRNEPFVAFVIVFVVVFVFVVVDIAYASAYTGTVGVVGSGKKMTEIHIEGDRVDGCHDT